MRLYDLITNKNIYHNKYLKHVINRYKKKTIKNKKIKKKNIKSFKKHIDKKKKFFLINNIVISDILLNNVTSILKNIRNKKAYTQYIHIPKKSKESRYIEPYIPVNSSKVYGILWNNIGFPLDKKGGIIKKYNNKLLKRLPRYFVDCGSFIKCLISEVLNKNWPFCDKEMREIIKNNNDGYKFSRTKDLVKYFIKCPPLNMNKKSYFKKIKINEIKPGDILSWITSEKCSKHTGHIVIIYKINNNIIESIIESTSYYSNQGGYGYENNKTGIVISGTERINDVLENRKYVITRLCNN